MRAQVRLAGSGLSLKRITVLNSPGTMLEDYRGEVMVILINLSTEDFKIDDGERMPQMVISKHEQVSLSG